MQTVVANSDGNESPHVVTLLRLSNDLLRRRWVLAALVMGCAIGAALVRLLQPRTYTSTASFVSETASPLSRPAGMGTPPLPTIGGTRLGRGVANSSSSLNRLGAPPTPLSSAPPVPPLDPGFYWRLLQSHALLVAVAGSGFRIPGPTGVRVGTAADLYELPAGPAAARIEDAARRLSRELAVDYSVTANVFTVRVRTFDPAFARAIVERVLEEVMATNRRMADARSEATLAFLGRAVADARGELLAMQNEFARFLSSNRAYVRSSPVALEFRRRDVEILEKRRQYADLALQFEQAKLDRSRATQIIRVVQRPEIPSRPDPRGVGRATVAGAIGGFAVALLALLTAGHVARLRAAGSDELRTLEREWRSGWRRRGATHARPGASAAVSMGSGEER